MSALFDLLRIVDDHLFAIAAKVCDTGRAGPVVGAEKDLLLLLHLKPKAVRLDRKEDFPRALDNPFFHLLSTGRTLHLQIPLSFSITSTGPLHPRAGSTTIPSKIRRGNWVCILKSENQPQQAVDQRLVEQINPDTVSAKESKRSAMAVVAKFRQPQPY